MSVPETIRRQLHPAIIALLIAFTISIVYFGAYSAMLRSKVYYPVGVDAATGINRHFIAPEYRLFEPTSAAFFLPAHRLDRHLRSGYWDTVEKTDGTKCRNP